MKCHACGYIGFDYLSECKSCGVDVSPHRDKLGFPVVKPSVPFFLGALLKNYPESMPNQERTFVGNNLSVSSIPDIEFGDEFELDGEHIEVQQPMTPPAQPAVMKSVPSVTNLIDDSMMIDLSDEELNQIIDDHGTGSDIELDLDLLLDGGSPLPVDNALTAAPMDKHNGSSTSTANPSRVGDDDSLLLELTDDDLNQFTHESEMVKAFEDELGLSDAPSATTAPSLETPTEAMYVPQGNGDNMAPELSDDDLHTMLLELDDAVGKKEGQMDA